MSVSQLATPGEVENRRLLLVEDNPGDAELIKELLQLRRPATVVFHATDLAGAAAVLLAHDVEAVLLDLGLPDGRGIECVRGIRASTKDVAIIVLTGLEDEDLALSCLAAGAQDYLSKQEVRSENLHRAIGYAIEGKRRDTELRRRNEELTERDRQMRALTFRLNAVREEERTRISREVHDEIGQLLTGLKMDLRWITRRLSSDPVPVEAMAVRLAEAEKLADLTIEAVQRIAVELRPSALDSLGLPAAIRDEARRFTRRSGVATHTEVSDQSPTDPEIATALFRIFQELLTNVARHAHASSVHITLSGGEEAWTLRVEDDGIGIRDDEARRPSSLGLLGMSERAKAFGGSIELEGTKGRGTIATVRVPRRVVDADAQSTDSR